MNPFTLIPDLYKSPIQYYLESSAAAEEEEERGVNSGINNSSGTSSSQRHIIESSLPPHVYSIASRAFQSLSNQNEEDYIVQDKLQCLRCSIDEFQRLQQKHSSISIYEDEKINDSDTDNCLKYSYPEFFFSLNLSSSNSKIGCYCKR